jgi:tRNA nucleotidyltransferase (CCA-adding enzyme)
MENQIKVISNQILQVITPNKEEYQRVEALSRKLEQKIRDVCRDEGVSAIVRVEGSVAKNTWLSGNPDIDIFVRLPTSIPRKDLGNIGLRIAKKAAGGAERVERFAEHPYLEIFLEGYRVDIVPCFYTQRGEWKSATDRTPYHTDYIKSHLAEQLQAEVRLLKKFMQGIGVYGAEIKVGGFSGYLCELLILKYGSFVDVIRSFAHINKRIVVDIEGFYCGREKEIDLLFPEPLVIIDPVDMGRNVASAVQAKKLFLFIGASRVFLKKPSMQFFDPPELHILTHDQLKDCLSLHGSALITIFIGELTVVPDVLWGQLFRTKRSLKKLLENNDYKVYREDVWSNEKTMSALVFELEQRVLPKTKKHLGPPLEREVECEKFLSKYICNELVVSGPYIENGRWIVEVPRKNTDAALLLKEKLADGGKNSGVADLIAKALKENLRILIDMDVAEVYSKDDDFAVFLTEFLIGKPFWLRA